LADALRAAFERAIEIVNEMRIFSFGGGVQSTAALVLAAQGRIDFQTFIFANVGADSENPATLAYVKQHAMPYATANGIELIELQKTFKRGARAGQIETVYGRTMGDNKSVPIPIRMSGNGAPGHRSCTVDFKINLIHRWHKEHGATDEQPAITGLGISLDELERARTDSGFTDQILEYPLIDLRFTRNACIKITSDAGLPVPPKSACYFCPFKSRGEWVRLRREQPDLFAKSVALEKRVNEKRGSLGKDFMFLHPDLRPLDQAVGDQFSLFDVEDNCESGYCMT
jgi:hypothetical protein